MGVPFWKSLASALTSNDSKITPLVDPDSQTRELPDGSRICKHLESDELKRHRHEDATTLYEVVKRGARVSGNGPMLGQRIKQSNGEEPFVWIRYNEVLDRSETVARAFRKLGQPAGQETFIGIYSKNRPEWIIVEQATYAFNNVLVPLYDTLGIDASAFIINQAGIQLVVCDTAKKVSGLLEKKNACPSLKHIILIETQISEGLKEQAMLNRLFDKVMAEVNKSWVKQLLFNAAIALKTHEIDSWIVRNNSWVDQYIFKAIRDGFGGRVKLMITGSAPVSDQVLTFVRCALGCFVIEGYGQTECVAACTVTIEGDAVPGHVGVPSPCNYIKLVDVPELNYFAKDQAGEVCVKGFNVFRGYYKNEEQTKLVLNSDGWLHTGDIGRWTERGTLKIVDRKKHIFKLAQGEYIAPEKIENVYLRSRYVAQCFVYGESLKGCLVGIVVPDAEVIRVSAMSELGIEGKATIEELCNKSEVKKLIMEDIISTGKNAGLASFEQVKDIFLCAEMFTVQNDLLTPTLKTKRPKLKEHFQKQLDQMYEHLY
uniref:long-chain-fatty-acid--CoA ligase n=1 Tax=Ditylenchus dipsaci TaxID=166011 RepID=A0A915DVP2_9BILA